MEEEPKVPRIAVIPDETVMSEKVCYNGVHVLLNFNNQDYVDSREERVDVDYDPSEQEMEDVRLDD